MTAESEAVKTVAGLMALSARTAPKAVGLDSIKIEILTGKAQEKLANQMIKQGKELKMDFFLYQWRAAESQRCYALNRG